MAMSQSPVDARGASRSPVLLIFALTLTYLLNYADRNIFVIAAPLIQAEFALSDGQLGLLTGVAFALLYSICGVPLGYLADRMSRRALLVGALVIWSLLTAATGLAATALQLAVMRVLVGVGESGCAPASHSLLGQHLNGSQRALGFAIFGVGAPLGMAVAFAGGGMLADVYGWRPVFIGLGLCGLPMAVLLWWVISPTLDAHETAANPERGASALSATDLFEKARGLARERPFAYLLIGNGLLFVAFGATLQWMPVFLHRVHGMTITNLGLWLGLTAGVASVIGNLAGAAVAVKLRAEDAKRLMKIVLVASVSGVPLLLCALLLESTTGLFVSLAFALALGAATTGPNYAAAQDLAGQGRRALGASLLLLTSNLVGIGIGTFAVGLVSDELTASMGSAKALRTALVVISAGSGALSAVGYALAIRSAANR